MEREIMRETIIRNRKALGLNINKLTINVLAFGNSTINLNTLGNKAHESNVFLADGLIVGYEV